MVNVHIEDILERDDSEVVSFLDTLARSSASVLAYHYPFYRDMMVAIKVGKPRYLGARINGELVGLLPSFSCESSLGVVFSSLPFFGPNAGVLCGCNINNDIRSSVHKELLGALLDITKKSEALTCSVYTPLLISDFSLYDAAFSQGIIVEKFTHYLNVSESLLQWESKIERNLRKARNNGIEVVRTITPESIEIFYYLYVQNCQDYGIPVKPKACIDILLDQGLAGHYSDLYLAVRDGQIIAGLIVLWSPATMSYYIPCTLDRYRTFQPGALLISQAIQDACERGIRVWNWESSPSRDSGVARFKRKWGSTESIYRIYVQLFQPRDVFRKIGADNLSHNFPYFFVIPFDYIQ